MNQFGPLAHHIEFFFEALAWYEASDADVSLIPIGVILNLFPDELKMLLEDFR